MPKSTFMDDMPAWLRVFVQLGFAGVIVLLYVLDSRDRSAQLRDMQAETRVQAREDRVLFRDEMKAQREALQEAVAEMRKAIAKLDTQHGSLKKEIDDIKNPFPMPHTKPQE